MVHAKVEKVWVASPAGVEGRFRHPQDVPLPARAQVQPASLQTRSAGRVNPGQIRALALGKDRNVQGGDQRHLSHRYNNKSIQTLSNTPED